MSAMFTFLSLVVAKRDPTTVASVQHPSPHDLHMTPTHPADFKAAAQDQIRHPPDRHLPDSHHPDNIQLLPEDIPDITKIPIPEQYRDFHTNPLTTHDLRNLNEEISGQQTKLTGTSPVLDGILKGLSSRAGSALTGGGLRDGSSSVLSGAVIDVDKHKDDVAGVDFTEAGKDFRKAVEAILNGKGRTADMVTVMDLLQQVMMGSMKNLYTRFSGMQKSDLGGVGVTATATKNLKSNLVLLRNVMSEQQTKLRDLFEKMNVMQDVNPAVRMVLQEMMKSGLPTIVAGSTNGLTANRTITLFKELDSLYGDEPLSAMLLALLMKSCFPGLMTGMMSFKNVFKGITGLMDVAERSPEHFFKVLGMTMSNSPLLVAGLKTGYFQADSPSMGGDTAHG